jgi:hypothetical protein
VTKICCPNGHWLNVSESLVGKKGKCPECGISFVIAAESPASADSKQQPAPRASTPTRPSQPLPPVPASGYSHPSTPKRQHPKPASSHSSGPTGWSILLAIFSGLLTFSAVVAAGLYFTGGWGASRPDQADGTVATSDAPRPDAPKKSAPNATAPLTSQNVGRASEASSQKIAKTPDTPVIAPVNPETPAPSVAHSPTQTTPDQRTTPPSNPPIPVTSPPVGTARSSRRRGRGTSRPGAPVRSAPGSSPTVNRPPNAVGVNALVLPEPFTASAADRFALNPETGDLAVILAMTGQFYLFRHDDLAAGKVQPVMKTQVGAIPEAIVYKRYRELSLFAVFCARDRHIFLVDATNGTLFKKIDTGNPSVGSMFAAASINPDDPFVYFSWGDPHYGGLNLRTMQLFRRVLQNACDFAVSAGGKYLYLRGGYHPSGFTSLVRLNGLDADTPQFADLYHEHIYTEPYVPDPFERYTSMGLGIYSATLIRDELRVRGVGCVPQCFFRKRPVMIGLDVEASRDRNQNIDFVLYPASYNSLTTCGTPVAVVVNKVVVEGYTEDGSQNREASNRQLRQLPLLFADDQHDCVVYARGRNVAVIPLEKFKLPDEPLLLASLEGPQHLKLGDECALKVKVDSRVKVTFDRMPDGMKADGLNLSWTPTAEQLGPAKIVLRLKFNNLERSQEFEIQVDRPSLELPFAPGDLTVDADGKRAVIWEYSSVHPRRRPNPGELRGRPIRLALVDLETGKGLAQRELEAVVRDVYFVRDRVVLVTEPWHVPQDANNPIQRQQLNCEICRLPDLSTEHTVVTESPIHTAQVIDKMLVVQTITNTEIYSIDPFERKRSIKTIPGVGNPPQIAAKEGLFISGVVYAANLKPALIVRAGDFPSLGGADFGWQPQSMPEPQRHRNVLLVGSDVHRMSTATLPDADVRISLDMRIEGRPWGPITRGGSVHLSERLVEVSLTASEAIDAHWIVARQVFLRREDDFRPILGVARGAAVVVFESQLYRLPVKAGSGGAPTAQPLAFVERQSALTLNASGKTVLTHVVQGGKPPYQFLLVDRLTGARVDEKTGNVTLDRAPLMPAIREAVKGAVGRLNRGEAYVDTFEAWSVKMIDRASDLLGRKATGIPVAIPICMNVEDADSNSARLQYCVLAELRKSDLATIPQELEKDRQSNKFGPAVTRIGNLPAKSPMYNSYRPLVPAPVQPANVNLPATSAQITEVHRAIREAIAALEAGEAVKFYEAYGPIDHFRALRDSRQLKSFHLSPATAQSLIATLKQFRDGEIRVDPDGLFARVTPPRDDKKVAEPESPNPLTAVGSPKDDKVTLVGYGDDLPKALKAGLAALEAGEFESFIDHFFPAGELGRLQASNGKAKLVARLKKQTELIEQMRADLKAASQIPAEFNAEKTVATFTLPAASDDPVTAPRIVKFQKISGSWRFLDNSTPVREELARQSRLVPPKLSYPVGLGGADSHALPMEKLGSSWRISRIPNL